MTAPTAEPAKVPVDGQRFWLWKNFVDGKQEYWAFDNLYPTHDGGDPMTLGEPCGYAIFKASTPRGAESAESRLAALQAKIDALMFEYCPDEMTAEQIEAWGKHQRCATAKETAAIDAALKGVKN